MYKLVLKGKEMEPIFLEDEKGKVVLEAYLQNKSVRLVANNQAFNTGDIKTIFLVEKSRAEKYSRNTTKQENEYSDFRKKMLALTLEQRSQIMRIPKMVWSSHTTESMPEDIKEKIKSIQLQYFTENPNCMYCNPIKYEHLIPKPRPSILSKDKMKSVGDLTPVSMLGFISNIIQRDLLDSKEQLIN